MYSQNFSPEQNTQGNSVIGTPKLESSYIFDTHAELQLKMSEMATDNSIRKIIANNEKMISFVCDNNQCEAIINGVYNSFINKYQITRLNLYHKCSLNTEVISKCILNYISKRIKLPVCELTTRALAMNYCVGYFETFSFLQFIKNGSKNINGFSTADVFNNIEFLIKSCIKCFEKEFKETNKDHFIHTGDDYIYFDNTDFIKYLRPVREIKLYEFNNYIVIFGVMYCPNNDPIISSVYVQHKSNSDVNGLDRAIDNFISCENLSLNDKRFIYLVEFDPRIISRLSELNKDYFIKSRSLVNFLDSTDQDGIEPVDYFLMLNYPTSDKICAKPNKLIRIHPSHFLRYKCKHNLFFLNNTHLTEFEFISDDLLQMDMFDFINLLIWHMQNDLKLRSGEYSDYILSDTAIEIMNTNALKATTKDINKDVCNCDKYKEFGIPCVHFFNNDEDENVKNTKSSSINDKKNDIDNSLYASKYYYKTALKNINNIKPLIQMGPAMYRNCKYKIKRINK